MCDNLNNFIHKKPPVALFLFALLIFAFGSACISLYIKNNDFKVGDAKKDWNVFLERFSSLEFCVNSSSNNQHGDKPNAPSSPPLGNIRNVSFPMMITIKPTRGSVVVPHILTSFIGVTHLGLKGDAEFNEPLEITMVIPINSSRCFNSTQGIGCDAMLTCITIIAPVAYLSHSNVNPSDCKPSHKYSSQSSHLVTMAAYKKSSNDMRPCKYGPIISLNHQPHPSLFASLSMEAKSTISLHLFHLSFFLLIMILLILLISLFKQRSLKTCDDNELYPDVSKRNLNAMHGDDDDDD